MIDAKQLIHALPLDRFPEVIATYQRQVLALKQRLRPLEVELARKSLEIEQTIAEDPELSNEVKRKSKRQELMLTPEFLANQKLVQDLLDEIELTKFDLEQVQNSFSVLKINVRQAIADKEIEAARLSNHVK